MYVRKLEIYASIIYFLLLGILTSCSFSGLEHEDAPTPILDPGFSDHTFLTGEPCLPPCWQGIQVGETSMEESVQQIRTLSFIDPGSVERGDERKQQLPYSSKWELMTLAGGNWLEPENEKAVTMWFFDNRLIKMYIFPNHKLFLVNLINLLGNPDYVARDPTGRGKSCGVDFIWLEYQLVITHWEETKLFGRDLCEIVRKNDYRVPKDLIASHIMILYKEGFRDFPLSHQHPWRGFIEE